MGKFSRVSVRTMDRMFKAAQADGERGPAPNPETRKDDHGNRSR